MNRIRFTRFLSGATAATMVSVNVSRSDKVSSSSEGDAAYLAGLSTSLTSSSLRSHMAVKSVTAPAASVIQTPPHAVTSVATDTGEDSYAAMLLRSHQGSSHAQHPSISTSPASSMIPVVITSLAAADALSSGWSVIGVTRGAPLAAAEALSSSLCSAAAALAAGGTFHDVKYRWVLITDDTPDDVAARIERLLHLQVPEKGTDDSPTLVVVSDSATRRKFLMPFEGKDDADDVHVRVEDVTVPDFDKNKDDATRALLAAVPFPSEIVQWLEKVEKGALKPSLLGTPRPLNDADPNAPDVTAVVSSSWEEIVLAPNTDVVLEAYLTHCPMCMCLSPRVRMAAQICEHFLPPRRIPIKVATINVDDNERPLDWMPGPSFPTIQLFAAAGAGGIDVGVGKLKGPRCGAALGRPASPEARIGRTTRAGTPACIPALDFSHPSVPGKMSLPTVTDLMVWIAANCSDPFAVSEVRVPLSSLKLGVDAGKSLGPRSAWSVALGVTESTDAAAAAASAAVASKSETIALAALLADMDAQARVLEAAAFDSLYYSHVIDALSASSRPAANIDDATTALLAAARQHAASQSAWQAAGGDVRDWTSKDGPVPDLGGFPLGVVAAAGRAQRDARMHEAVTTLKAVAIDGAAYGAADAAWIAMEVAADVAEATGARVAAAAWLRDQDELRATAAALPLLTALMIV